MNVLHIIDSLATGGAEKLLVNTVKYAPWARHHILTLTDGDSLSSELPDTCALHSLGFRSKKDAFRSIRQIRAYIKKHEIDLVHSHLVMSNIFSRLATPRQIPLFNSLHNLNGEKIFSRRRSLPTLLEKITYRKRHRIIAVSKAVLDDYQQYIGIKGEATVLHNFVDEHFFAPSPKTYQHPGTLRMVAVGTLKKQKNYHFLLDVFRRLPASCSLHIYGDGPLKEELQKKIDTSSVAVKLCGNHPAIHSVIRDYDLYVMSSQHEGHPIALVEAMASGMPALVSDIPVLHEAMGEGGLYFNLADPDDFVGKITRILDGSLPLNSYAEFNWKRAAQTARQEDYIHRLYSLYTDAIKKDRSRK